MFTHKRKSRVLCLALIIILLFVLACSPAIPPQSKQDEQEELAFVGLSVHYLDVGQGECILIRFPDDKNMLIDCGNGTSSSSDKIISELRVKQIESIDYFVLTHPDDDHIGGVKKVLNDVAVKSVYHPDIPLGLQGFENYYSTMEFFSEKGAETKISLRGECFGEDYKVAILAPTDKRLQGSSYREFLWELEPSEIQINDLSPYIYLEYKGVRFLFTGDCSKEQEIKLINDYGTTLFNKTFKDKGVEINLENIDFLKVSHHGSGDASCREFLNFLKPKYAVISVSGDNAYGHPSTAVIKRIMEANEKVGILRTDNDGDVSVFVNSSGEMTFKTQTGEKEKA